MNKNFNHGVTRSYTELHGGKESFVLTTPCTPWLNFFRIMFLAIIYLFLGLTLNAQTAALRYAVVPDNPRPGEPVTIGVSGGAAQSAVLTVGGKRLAKAAFFAIPAEGGKQAFMAAVLAIPSTAQPGGALITVEGAAGVTGEIAITITAREFAAEVIELNAALTGIRTEPDPQKTAEANHLWSILNRTGDEDGYLNAFHFDKFTPPVTSTRRTSFFGDRRVYKYSNGTTDTSIHAGIDYGVPTGTAVITCGRGKVILARNRIVTGNSVIVEHLPGVYSLYYHLDKIEVYEGFFVENGVRIGLSGATGLATGPHLHWEIRVSGENTDPDAFIVRPILDKDAILSKLGL